MSDYPWVDFPEEKLLKMRICDLGLRLEGSEVERRITRIYDELSHRRIELRPRVYVGDEWYSPEGVVAIAVPFYLLHPRLMSLEQKIMLEVEGGDEEWFMRIIRHESGHCVDHAFGLSKKKSWRKIFGSPDIEYNPDWYKPRVYSHRFVRNLQHGYAQSHPDEDFAETFAVWLNPSVDWKSQYAKWPGALKKLTYVDSLMRSLENQKPRLSALREATRVSPYTRSKITLEKFYLRRKHLRAEENPDFFDNDLKKLFNGDSSLPISEYGAGKFMKRHRKFLVDIISRWTGEHKYSVDHFLKRLTLRVDEIPLRINPNHDTSSMAMEVATYLTSLVSLYRHTGRYSRKV